MRGTWLPPSRPAPSFPLFGVSKNGHVAENGRDRFYGVSETQEDHAVMGADVSGNDVLEQRVTGFGEAGGENDDPL